MGNPLACAVASESLAILESGEWQTQVAAIALAAVRQYVDRKGQRAPAAGTEGILFTNALMALSPIENMAHHPVRQAHNDAEHRRTERHRVAMLVVALQK